MKRLNSVFRKDKSRNGTATAPDSYQDRKKSVEPLPPEKLPASNDPSEGPDHSIVRGSIATNLEKFTHVIHAANRPLPTGTGDGSYVDDPKQGGLFDDLKAMRVKDYATLNQLFTQHLSGSVLTDDKTMIMERVIQVNYFRY